MFTDKLDYKVILMRGHPNRDPFITAYLNKDNIHQVKLLNDKFLNCKFGFHDSQCKGSML